MRDGEMAKEIIFLVEDAPEGGYVTQALGYSIFTEADTWEELKQAVRDAVQCHFDEGEQPDLIRLRNKRLDGLKFRRQHPLGPFIADFYCAACRLVVEIDGDIHDLQPEREVARTEQFAQYGYRVIRFRNKQVLNDIEDVLAAIEAACTVDSEEKS